MFSENEFIDQCDKIREANDEYLEIFYNDLKLAGLKDNTVTRHVANVDLYLNTYLLDYEGLSMTDGIQMVGDYLGNFFIRKCMWSTPASIKSNATSIKKFYKCMLKHEKILKIEYELLCGFISSCLESWQDTCAVFNDPYSPNPFSPF